MCAGTRASAPTGNGNGLWSIRASTLSISKMMRAGVTVVDVQQVIRDLSGKILLDRMVQHVYSIENGLITRMDIREPDSGTMAGSTE